MPGSLHLALRTAVAARLLASPALADGQVKVGKRRPMPQAVNAQIYVDLDESAATGAALTSTEWNTRIRVECVTRDSVTDADVAADTLMTSVHNRLMAEPTFSGAAIDTQPLGMAWRPDDETETGLAACQALFNVRHRTPRSSIAA